MSNRTYSQAFNDGKAAPSFQYIFDPNVLTTGSNGIITGAYRPFNINDVLSPNISVSGLTISVGSVAITGNPQVTISNTIIPISGNTTIANSIIPISGITTISNAVVSISGIVQPIFTGNVITQSAGDRKSVV